MNINFINYFNSHALSKWLPTTYSLTMESGTLGTYFKFREEQSMILAGSEQRHSFGHQNVAIVSRIGVNNTRKHAANRTDDNNMPRLYLCTAVVITHHYDANATFLSIKWCKC